MVVTSGTRSLVAGRIAHLGLPMPERFVTADDVSKGKPHPEAYLKGAEILKTRREACVVVEDAPLGNTRGQGRRRGRRGARHHISSG